MPFDITAIVNSQAPWMLLSAILIAFIIKMQQDNQLELCKSVSALVLLYEKHDKQAAEIHMETKYIRDWCVSNSGNESCRPEK